MLNKDRISGYNVCKISGAEAQVLKHLDFRFNSYLKISRKKIGCFSDDSLYLILSKANLLKEIGAESAFWGLYRYLVDDNEEETFAAHSRENW
ncbi:hypothetical protein M5689_000298 [Euphorbia peplus]|nr:hypothetical protein M5689_000298 [Euphorbia peplus]